MSTKCRVCTKALYPMDPQINIDGTKFHRSCAKCADCSCQITISNFTKSEVDGALTLLCKVHYFKRFKEGGSYVGGEKFQVKSTRDVQANSRRASTGTITETQREAIAPKPSVVTSDDSETNVNGSVRDRIAQIRVTEKPKSPEHENGRSNGVSVPLTSSRRPSEAPAEKRVASSPSPSPVTTPSDSAPTPTPAVEVKSAPVPEPAPVEIPEPAEEVAVETPLATPEPPSEAQPEVTEAAPVVEVSTTETAVVEPEAEPEPVPLVIEEDNLIVEQTTVEEVIVDAVSPATNEVSTEDA